MSTSDEIYRSKSYKNKENEQLYDIRMNKSISCQTFFEEKVSHRILVMRKLKVTRQNIFISLTMKDIYSACIITLQKY